MMFAYYDKNNQVAMLSQGKLDAPNFKELEISDTDPAIIEQKTKGGQLYAENGIIKVIPIEAKPIDAVAEMNDALSASKTFSEFKTNLAAKLTK